LTKTGIPAGWLGLDVGPKSNAIFTASISALEDHHLERPPWRVSSFRPSPTVTKAMADAIAQATASWRHHVVGGGDTATRGEEIQSGRQGLPLLHRRRRQPRISRGQGPPRRRLPRKLIQLNHEDTKDTEKTHLPFSVAFAPLWFQFLFIMNSRKKLIAGKLEK